MNPEGIPSILEVYELNFNYPDQTLFVDLSLTVPTGISLICGGVGLGKSTLIRLLAGALPAQSGLLRINGVDLQAQPIAYKAQIFWAEPWSTAFDELTLPDYFELQRSNHAGFDDRALTDMTEGLGLQDHLHKQLFMLSTGSKRKVFLAAAFASGAAVTLLDEPFAALDAKSTGFMLLKLKRAAREGHRAFVLADFLAPDGVPLVKIIDLGD